MMAILMLIFSWTMVASSQEVIWNPPSPDHHPNFRFRPREFCTNRGRQSKSHGASPPEVIRVRGRVVVVILRFPHLVLAHVGDHDGVRPR